VPGLGTSERLRVQIPRTTRRMARPRNEIRYFDLEIERTLATVFPHKQAL